MAVTVKVGGSEERVLGDVTDSWIVDQIGRRERDGIDVCVVVTVVLAGINVRLATPACGSSGGGYRPPNNREQEIIDLWNKRKLNSEKIASGELIAFLHQLRKFI